MSERPKGLRLVSTIQFIGGIAVAASSSLAFFLAIYLTRRMMSDVYWSDYDLIVTPRFIRFATMFGVTLLIVGILGCVAAYGLWKLKPWGFFAAITANGLIIPVFLWIGDHLFVEWFVGSPLRPFIWIMIASLLWIPIVFLVYLFFIREHFK